MHTKHIENEKRKITEYPPLSIKLELVNFNEMPANEEGMVASGLQGVASRLSAANYPL